LLFENRMQKMRNPACASFFEVAKQAHSVATVLLSILQILVLLLDIWPQNSYADFCFIKCGLNIVMRHGCRYRCHPDLVMAAARGRWWLLAKQRQPRKPVAEPAQAPPRPALQEVSQFMLLEREVEIEYRPRMLEALQNKVDTVADSLQGQVPVCSQCHQTMKRHDAETVSWVARFGGLHASVARYRCPTCRDECRPLLDLLGVEPGRISGSLARLLALLAVVAPYSLAAALAELLLGVKISPMGIWKVVQRLGESACRLVRG